MRLFLPLCMEILTFARSWSLAVWKSTLKDIHNEGGVWWDGISVRIWRELQNKSNRSREYYTEGVGRRHRRMEQRARKQW